MERCAALAYSSAKQSSVASLVRYAISKVASTLVQRLAIAIRGAAGRLSAEHFEHTEPAPTQTQRNSDGIYNVKPSGMEQLDSHRYSNIFSSRASNWTSSSSTLIQSSGQQTRLVSSGQPSWLMMVVNGGPNTFFLTLRREWVTIHRQHFPDRCRLVGSARRCQTISAYQNRRGGASKTRTWKSAGDPRNDAATPE